MTKINYVIATWSGNRIAGTPEYYEDVLKIHLKKLSKTKNNISQITIMKPLNDIVNDYYNIKLSNKMKIIGCENKFQSYGQWLKAAKLFIDDFDYFIFIEDDYVPGCDNFDQKLIDMYEEDTYLSTSVNMPDNIGHYLCISSITNGIISSKTLSKVINTIDYDFWMSKYGELCPRRVCFGGNYQMAFSRYFQENNINLREFAHKYKAEFHDRGQIHDFSRAGSADERIFMPIQLILNEYINK